MTRPRIIVLTGPTAAGKTELSLKLAKKFHGEIISADSRQVYRGMDIGTAKPTAAELKSIKHHLINIRKPNQSYSLAQFKRDCFKAIKQIQKRGKVPFLVGGTAYYLNAIVNNLQVPEVKPDAKLRKRLEKLSSSKLFAMLKKKDPARAKTIDPFNKRRLIRALEIVRALGHVPSLPRRGEGQGEVEILILAIKKPVIKLRAAISQRVEKMFKTGLLPEVKSLTKRYPPSLSLGEAGDRNNLLFDTIGYREVIDYLDGKLTLEQTKTLIQSNTWKFSRRQHTWFRKMPVIWIKNQTQAEREVKKFLKSNLYHRTTDQ